MRKAQYTIQINIKTRNDKNVSFNLFINKNGIITDNDVKRKNTNRSFTKGNIKLYSIILCASTTLKASEINDRIISIIKTVSGG